MSRLDGVGRGRPIELGPAQQLLVEDGEENGMSNSDLPSEMTADSEPVYSQADSPSAKNYPEQKDLRISKFGNRWHLLYLADKRDDKKTDPHPTSQQIEQYKRVPLLKHLLAGGAAGAVAKTSIAPLDRSKINFQVSSTRRYSVAAVLDFVRTTSSREGVRSLWRGNSAQMARIVPHAAIVYATREQYSRLLGIKSATRQDARPAPLRRWASGALAGATSVLLTYPLDIARTNLAVSDKRQYRNLIDVISRLWRAGRLRFVYRGLSVSLFGIVPYAGTTFLAFDSFRLLYNRWQVERRRGRGGGEGGNGLGGEQPKLVTFVSGALAGLLGQSVSYPLEIIKRRIQIGQCPANVGLLSLMLHIGRSEGVVSGLYKGLSMNWIKGPIASGISFSIYDFILHLIC